MISLSELANPHCDLSNIFQSILARYYLVPFQNSSTLVRDEKYFAITDPSIARCTHGAMHAARVAAYIKVIHLFRQDYDDLALYDLASFAKTFQLSLVQIIHLVQIAGLFHDAAREDEGPDHWDSESAQICLNFLRTSIDLLPDPIAQLIANTIAYKDDKTQFWNAAQSLGFLDEHKSMCDYLRQLVHDADCLDVMRVRKKFKIDYLEIMKSSCLKYARDQIIVLVKTVRDLIHQQGDQYFDCYIITNHMKPLLETTDSKLAHFNIESKCTYEHADNVYKKIISDFQACSHLAKVFDPIQDQLSIKQTMYSFNTKLIQDMQQAFMSASIVPKRVEASNIECRDYFLIKFPTPILTACHNGDNYPPQDVVALLYRGDGVLNQQCNQALLSFNVRVEIGFNWHGVYNGSKHVQFNGFSLKIIYPMAKHDLQQTVLSIIAHELQRANLIEDPNAAWVYAGTYATPPRLTSASSACFFSRTGEALPSAHFLDDVENYIRQYIPPITALYTRQNELSINPCYQPIESVTQPLTCNQKKIWVLRADLTLAVGNKNSNWIYFGDVDLSNALDEELHPYLNWEDRYGHPSLAITHPGFDGSVYYGGYLAQRDDHLEIYTFSGRFFRQDLEAEQKAILEAYIVHQFQRAYGLQKAVFIDAVAFSSTILDNYELSFFIRDQALPEYCTRRWYDPKKIQSIFADLSLQNITPPKSDLR